MPRREAGGHANATFRVGDVTDLPFDDDSFDVAHCHAVLMHVPDTPAVLAEVRRVLKPGGIIASREVDHFILVSLSRRRGDQPGLGHVRQALAGNGGHPDMGLELKARLREAGFADIRASGSFDFFGSAGDVAFFHGFINDWFYSPKVTAAIVQFGLASQQELDGWQARIDEWKANPGAVGAIAFGEAVAFKP